jgi:hypothetical protein
MPQDNISSTTKLKVMFPVVLSRTPTQILEVTFYLLDDSSLCLKMAAFFDPQFCS